MKDEALAQALFRSLLVLRVTLGIFLLQWGIEKFVMLGNTPAIWGYFYGIDVPQAAAYHLFIASVPVLGAFIALFLLRHWDQGVFDRRNRPALG
jgi:putative oxidoreductase